MKTMLCDIGGVLLHVHFDRAFSRLAEETGIGQTELNERIFSSGLKEDHDRGVISSREFYRRSALEKVISYERFEVCWSDIFTENSEMVECLRDCARKYRLFIASNTDPLHFSYFTRRFPWFSLFKGFGLSYRLKSLKPEPDFFVRLSKEFSIPLKETLFVDDLEENVRSASIMGIRSHLYSDIDRFREFAGL